MTTNYHKQLSSSFRKKIYEENQQNEHERIKWEELVTDPRGTVQDVRNTKLFKL